MTRLERKRGELEAAREMWRKSIARGDGDGITRWGRKVRELEYEVFQIEGNNATTLYRLMDGKDEQYKNRFYRNMLRISLLADAVNEACEQVRSDFRNEFGQADFSLNKEVKQMAEISQRIASFAIIDKGVTEDMMVDNEKFVDMCIKHADAHLKRKLKLKV